MARREDRIRRGLRIALPLVGIALIASIFLLAHPRPPVEHEVDEPLGGTLVTRPRFLAQLDDGSRLEVTATQIREADENGEGAGTLSLEAPHVVIRPAAADRAALEIFSRHAVLDPRGPRGAFTGNAKLVTEGLAIESEQVRLEARDDGRTLRLEAGTPVLARMISGEIHADRAELSYLPVDPDASRALFKGNVRLLYTPESTSPRPAGRSIADPDTESAEQRNPK